MCVTLGHGLVSNPVTNHPYFATERVLRDLERMPGFASGLLHFRHGSVRRGQDGRVIGFNVSRLYSAGGDTVIESPPQPAGEGRWDPLSLWGLPIGIWGLRDLMQHRAEVSLQAPRRAASTAMAQLQTAFESASRDVEASDLSLIHI